MCVCVHCVCVGTCLCVYYVCVCGGTCVYVCVCGNMYRDERTALWMRFSLAIFTCVWGPHSGHQAVQQVSLCACAHFVFCMCICLCVCTLSFLHMYLFMCVCTLSFLLLLGIYTVHLTGTGPLHHLLSLLLSHAALCYRLK